MARFATVAGALLVAALVLLSCCSLAHGQATAPEVSGQPGWRQGRATFYGGPERFLKNFADRGPPPEYGFGSAVYGSCGYTQQVIRKIVRLCTFHVCFHYVSARFSTRLQYLIESPLPPEPNGHGTACLHICLRSDHNSLLLRLRTLKSGLSNTRSHFMTLPNKIGLRLQVLPLSSAACAMYDGSHCLRCRTTRRGLLMITCPSPRTCWRRWQTSTRTFPAAAAAATRCAARAALCCRMGPKFSTPARATTCQLMPLTPWMTTAGGVSHP